jgi:RimJ/RimL family protein N-acetyltransferase
LRLRPAEHADLDRLWALWTDPDVRRFLWDDVTISREHAAEVLGGLIEAGVASGRGLWTWRLSATVDLPNEASHRLVRRLGFVRREELDGPKYRMIRYTLDAPSAG